MQVKYNNFSKELNGTARIYKITNNINNSTYIGMTTMTLEDRWKNHIKESEDNIKHGRIYHWVKKFGEENFTIEQIDETFYRHRFIVEQYYIEQELKKSNYCLNKDVKGEKFKKVMSLVTTGRKNGMYGKKGENAVNGQTVYMLDDDGNVIKEFKSVQLVLKFLNIKGHAGLYNAIKENKKYHGYYWKKTNKKYY